MNRKEQIAAAEEFLRELGKGIPEEERVMAGYAAEATVQTDERGKKMNAGWWPVPWKEGKWIDDSKNCYACISSSVKTPNPKNGEMRYWRGEASFGHGLALMVDDVGSGAGSKGNLTISHFESILPPTVVVETSPGNFQLWYFLKQPEPDMLLFKSMLVCFVEAVIKEKGGDWTIRDVSRYGRMPVGINNKRVNASPGAPLKYPIDWRVRIVSADYSRRYSPRNIADAFGFVILRLDAPSRGKFIALDPDEIMDTIWFKLAERILAATKQGEGSGGDLSLNMSGKYRIRCPWGDNHSNGDPYGAYFRGPTKEYDFPFVFGCSHDSCSKVARHTWSAFVDFVVMPYVEYQLEKAAAAALKTDDERMIGLLREQ